MEEVRGLSGLQEYLRIKGRVALFHATILLAIWAWVHLVVFYLVSQGKMGWRTGVLMLICCISMMWAAIATSLLVAYSQCAVVRIQGVTRAQAMHLHNRSAWRDSAPAGDNQ